MAFKSGDLVSTTATTETDLIQAASGKTAFTYNIIICNYSGSTATVTMKKTNSSNTELARIMAAASLANGETMTLDSKIHLGSSQDKIRVTSSQGNVSFHAAYWEED